MSEYTNEVGTYLDPNLIDMEALQGIGNLRPSMDGGLMSVGEIPLLDGSVAIVNEEGIITGYK